MASTVPNTILLKLNGGAETYRPIEEDLVTAGSTVTPGHFLIFSAGTVLPHNDNAPTSKQPPIVAVENPYLDPRTATSKAIDTAYAAAAVCYYVWAQPGDVVYGFLANGANVAEGAALESDGAGGVQAFTTGIIVGWAAEALNNATGAQARLRIRIA